MNGVDAVAEDLHFDMARPADEFLEIEAAVAESRLGFGRRLIEQRLELSAVSATRMPRPPPPAAALIITGKPILRGQFARLALVGDAPSEPGTTGTPAFCAALAGRALSPMVRIVAALGPTNIKPARSTASAKSAFSDRKP